MSKREHVHLLDAEERGHNFNEINPGFTPEQAMTEAARCLTCATAPCADACPVGNDIPRYLAAIADGRFEDGVFTGSFPLTAVCGRVCYRPCEAACTLGINGESMSINMLERFAADQRGVTHPVAPASRHERVAIIGSGPAGLACAYELRRAGCRVAVFEAAGVCGGMLALGIPAYRLPRDVLDRELSFLREMDIHLVVNQPIGTKGKISLEALHEHFNAVFIGVGAQKGKRLGVPGDDLPGVVDAVAFLRRVNLGHTEPPGKRAVIVGGGDSAMDAARTAVRLGCEEVIVLYRRGRTEMPCNPGEFEDAEEEGVKGIFLAAPVRVIAGEDQHVAALECIRMQLGAPDSSGRPRPEPVPGSEFILETDCVIPAVSQDTDLETLSQASSIQTTKWGTLVVNSDTLETSVPGIFAGGDDVTGPRTVTEAIAMGRRAADAILRYMNIPIPSLEHLEQ